MELLAGNQFKPKNTSTIRNCGINPGDAIGTVFLVSNGFVSFQLVSGDLTIEARTTDEIFKVNFNMF